MDYGTKRDDLQRVGGSGDGGIDGVISLDKLGLEKVYVQAKRWQSSVGEDRKSRLSTVPWQASVPKKGVFITTSLVHNASNRLRQVSRGHRAGRRSAIGGIDD